MAGLSRAQFEKNFGVNQRSLKGYENGENPINDVKLTLFKNIFHSIGYNLYDETQEVFLDNTDIMIKKEIDFFKENNENYILFTISNHLMSPTFNIGDIIGGVKSFEKEMFLKFLGSICIILNETEEKFVGRLLDYKKNEAILGHINYVNSSAIPITKVHVVQSMALVTRHWCVNK